VKFLIFKKVENKNKKIMENKDYIKELTEIIQSSSLSENDKGIWVDILKSEIVPKITAIEVLDYLKEFPDKLQQATEMLKRKIKAFKSKDEDAWNQILAEEEAELEAIKARE